MKVKKAKKGFTLIELISVVAIILILALIALPSLSGYKEKARTSQAVSSAKIVLNAIETYNAEKTPAISEESTIQSIMENANKDNVEGKLDNYLKKGDQIKFLDQMNNSKTVSDIRKFVDSNGKLDDIRKESGKQEKLN